jgi:GT2 family glycosyltransferase
VIVAFRAGAALRRCLESLDADIEIVVVDNGEGGSEIDEAERDERVSLVRPGKNLGFAAGCNRGAERASGDTLVFLNPDTVAQPGAIPELAGAVADPSVGIAMARLRLLDQPELLNSDGNVVHLTGLSWVGGHGEPASRLTEPREIAYPSGAAMAIRSDTFRQLGRFTGELFMYLEDLELGWRARLHGLRVIVTPAADVLHDYDYTRNPGKEHLIERNRLVFVSSSYSWRLLLLLAPLLTAAELAMVLVALRRGWLRGKLAGWGWCVCHARWLAGHRRETQRLRRVGDRELVRYLTPVLDPGVVELPHGVGAANALMSAYWRLARKAL